MLSSSISCRRVFVLAHLFLVACRGSTYSNQANLLDTSPSATVAGQALYFHWGSVEANSMLLRAGGFSSVDGHERQLSNGVQIPVSEAVMALVHGWYRHADLAGPGIYLSGDAADSGLYGSDLLVFRAQSIDGESFQVNSDLRFLEKAERAFSFDAMETLPPMTRILAESRSGNRGSWYVVSRAPGATDSFSLNFGPPTAADVGVTWNQMRASLSREILFMRLSVLAHLILNKNFEGDLVPQRTRGSEIFLHRLLFDEGAGYLQSLNSASDLTPKERTSLALITTAFAAIIPHDRRTAYLESWVATLH